MDFNKFDYNVERTKNHILVNNENWIQDTSSDLKIYKINGKQINTFVTEVLAVNAEDKFKSPVCVGKKVILTKLISEIAVRKGHKLIGSKEYYDVPLTQVIGVFEDEEMTLNKFTPIFDKLIIEKITSNYDGKLLLPNDKSTIGKVVKVGTCRFDKDWNKLPLTIKEGDIVLIKDNVTTNVSIEGKSLLATEESAVVAIFKDNKLNIDEATFINGSIILSEFRDKYVLGSFLLTPDIAYEDLDESSSIYNRNLFKVEYLDHALKNLKEGDIVLLNGDITYYVYIDNNRYEMVNNLDNIEATIKL